MNNVNEVLLRMFGIKRRCPYCDSIFYCTGNCPSDLTYRKLEEFACMCKRCLLAERHFFSLKYLDVRLRCYTFKAKGEPAKPSEVIIGSCNKRRLTK